MKIKRKGNTTEIRFDNRKESIAMLRAFGMHRSADALQALEDAAPATVPVLAGEAQEPQP